MEKPAPVRSKQLLFRSPKQYRYVQAGNGGGGGKLKASLVVRYRSRTIETLASLSFGTSITTVTDSTVEVLLSCAQQVDCAHTLLYNGA